MSENDAPKKWTYEQLKAGDTYLSQFAGNNRFETQRGMTGIGMPRWNITKDKKLGYVEADMKGHEIHRPQMGSNKYESQKGMTCIGANRPTKTPQKFKEGDEFNGLSKETESILPKQSGDYGFASQQGKPGEEGIGFGKKRNTKPSIVGKMPKAVDSAHIVPFQAGTNAYATQAGMNDPPAHSMPRQVSKYIDGMDFEEEDLRKGTEHPLMATGSNKFASQKLSGGFHRVRDVLPHIQDSKPISEEEEQKTHGIVRLQSGTNQLASQRGMTGFGTPRLNINKPVYKKEWVEMYDEAMKEWEVTRPKFSDSPMSSKRSTKQVVEVEEPVEEEAAAEEEAEEEEAAPSPGPLRKAASLTASQILAQKEEEKFRPAPRFGAQDVGAPSLLVYNAKR